MYGQGVLDERGNNPIIPMEENYSLDWVTSTQNHSFIRGCKSSSVNMESFHSLGSVCLGIPLFLAKSGPHFICPMESACQQYPNFKVFSSYLGVGTSQTHPKGGPCQRDQSWQAFANYKVLSTESSPRIGKWATFPEDVGRNLFVKPCYEWLPKFIKN